MGFLLWYLSGVLGIMLVVVAWATKEGDIDIDVGDLLILSVGSLLGFIVLFAGVVMIIPLFVQNFHAPKWWSKYVFTMKGLDKT